MTAVSVLVGHTGNLKWRLQITLGSSRNWPGNNKIKMWVSIKDPQLLYGFCAYTYYMYSKYTRVCAMNLAMIHIPLHAPEFRSP